MSAKINVTFKLFNFQTKRTFFSISNFPADRQLLTYTVVKIRAKVIISSQYRAYFMNEL